MSKNTRAIFLVVVFLCATAISYAQIAAGVMFLRKRVHHLTQQDGSGVDKVTKELAKQLNLTSDQQDKVKGIILETKKNIELFLEQGDEAINSLLSADQKAKFADYRNKIKEELKDTADTQ